MISFKDFGKVKIHCNKRDGGNENIRCIISDKNKYVQLFLRSYCFCFSQLEWDPRKIKKEREEKEKREKEQVSSRKPIFFNYMYSVSQTNLEIYNLS